MDSNSNELARLASRGWTSLLGFSKIADVSYPTAMAMAKRGEVRVTQVGGVRRVYADEVQRFLREGNVKGTGENPVPST